MKKSLVKELEKRLGKSSVLIDEGDRALFSYDAAYGEKVLPDIVVFPENKDDLQFVINLMSENEIPIITRGAGTNLSGGTVPVSGGCVLVTTKMNRILEINEKDLYAVVEAGVVTKQLADKVEEYGLFYPPDPGSMNISTIGGNVAENAGGLRGLKYGVTKDYVMGVKLFDMAGNEVIGGGKTVKLVTGFNIPGLMISSEGMLGIMYEVILKLVPKPATSKSMLVEYSSVIDACNTVSEIIASKILPSTLELMDNFTINAVEESEKIGLPVKADALLLIEVDGHPAVVEDEFIMVKKICEKNKGNVKVADNNEERDKLWTARRKALSCLARLKPTLILEDATVPRSKIPDMMKAIKEIASKYNITIGTFGHAGDGNLHPTILTDKRDEDEFRRVEKAIDEIFEKALLFGGTLSGEHGVGLLKAKYMEMEVGKGTLNFMKNLKMGVDSKNLLNPHKMGL
ncbi:FAD-binding protein [Deferribacter autotrophicus]|uniref:FAD-binding protein n=1 Tax=Deferribacter autotrophicus TaxID=500465 RepID=A0A5A8F7T8_9BACT|nr:FAD-linked oxidase C-terminal domain-containing protein [Deferribacter autotrophicus]KAA0259529.1 FAD-binding protein [Deferribacter autotrophicus]